MREILFKAKRKDNCEWVEGGYFSEPYTEKKFIICWNSFGLGFNEFIEVNPDTLCQYTGLTDKNGKKIFDGDIVRDGENYGEVKFGLYESDWQIDKYNQGFFVTFPKEYLFRRELGFWRNKIVVVSNIFDNANLLEVE